MISRLQAITIRIKGDQNSGIRSAKGLVKARPAASGTAEYGRVVSNRRCVKRSSFSGASERRQLEKCYCRGPIFEAFPKRATVVEI